jgi:ankyrin repeat protein
MSDALRLPTLPSLDHYKKLAKDLQHACRSGEAAPIRAWGRRLTDNEQAVESIERSWLRFRQEHERAVQCLLTDAQFFIAREFGFSSWPAFASHVAEAVRDDSAVATFERAVEAIVSGDALLLERLLREQSRLIRQRSTRAHHSTLLHYVSANGVEDYRQKTPPNIVAITLLLLDAGADIDAESDAYGGHSTTLGLVATSVHPDNAGVQIPLMELLVERGADVHHPGLTGNGHSAVWGSLANGCGRAARWFAAHGARMNLEEAAGVGALETVRQFVDERGAPGSGAAPPQLALGLLYACGYGHIDVVRFLLDQGVSPAVPSKRGETGLHWVSYGPHLDVARLLIERGAPVNAEDAQGATPLVWAIRAWARADDDEERAAECELVTALAAAGADVSLRWFEADERRRRFITEIDRDPGIRAALHQSAG